MSNPTILLGLEEHRYTSEDLEAIRAIAPSMRILTTPDDDQISDVLANIEIIVGDFPRDRLSEMPNLRWIQQWRAGIDWLFEHPEAQDLPFTLTNASGVHAIPITEHILSFMFTFARAFPAANAIRRQRR